MSAEGAADARRRRVRGGGEGARTHRDPRRRREFTRAWAKELVVYLAMHPKGSTNEAWATALWPDRLMAPSSLHSTASVARRALGRGPDGIDHLPRSHGRLALSPSVVTDWDRFVELAESPAIDQWRSALDLVRGRPFEGLRSSDWPILEGIGPAIEAAVVDLSGRLAGAYLAAGDSSGAEWSARKGLLVSPYDERLYRMLYAGGRSGRQPGRGGVGHGRAGETRCRRRRAIRFRPSEHDRSLSVADPEKVWNAPYPEAWMRGRNAGTCPYW